jgi:hypothetical protein
MRRYWDVCVAIIAQNPFSRDGAWIEKIAPIANISGHTYLYEIADERRVSGERIYTFTAEFFPWHIIVYVIDEDENEVQIVYLRENHLV